jgi:hypothetical protein
VITEYRFVLEESAFESFVRIADEDPELVHAFFQWLAANPHTTGRGFHNDKAGRPNYASLCGPFIVVHWTDHAAKEVRSVQILRS